MERESDDLYEGPYRRPLKFGAGAEYHPRQYAPREADSGGAYARPGTEPHAHGPEAYQRAAEMNYEHIRRVQEESPFVQEEVVEHHVVHDWRLYGAMWIIAVLSFAIALPSFDWSHLLVGALATCVALYCTPGRQRRGGPDRSRNLT